MQKQLFWVLISMFALTNLNSGAEEKWRFITLADWHSAEKYVQSEKNPEWLEAAIDEDIEAVKMIKKNFGGELMLLPGDSNGGHWDTQAFIKNFDPKLTPEESILKAGRLCYTGMISAFKKGGYSKLLMAVGDHELGDNPWPAGSAVARCQPQFREAFSNAFNVNPDGGKFIYSKPIGKVPSQPIGTIFENTSYAYKYKNVLFVTVDTFHFEGPKKKLGDEGTVTGAVTGKHLEWLDKVLAEGRKNPETNHVFVQGHLPVIYPVRKVNSSGMLMDNGTDCEFWGTLRKHKVDIYFAGEVHANTVTKDTESDLIQLVSRGNFFNNFLTIDISDKKIDIALLKQVSEKASEGKYRNAGRLVIDKRSQKTSFINEGGLSFLDVSDRLFHFTFEKSIALKDRMITGLKRNGNKKSGSEIRDVKCSNIFPNEGAFGDQYDALYDGVNLINGPRGNAGQFGKNSRMAIWGMGPNHGEHALSYALWINSSSKENQVLINSCPVWSKALKDFLNLNLNDGIPEVMVSKTRRLSAITKKLNDGKWHHLAVAMPRDGCKLSEVQIFINGRLAKSKVGGADIKLKFNNSVRMSFGGMGYSNKSFDALKLNPFFGAMDDISVWTRALNADEVFKLAK